MCIRTIFGQFSFKQTMFERCMKRLQTQRFDGLNKEKSMKRPILGKAGACIDCSCRVDLTNCKNCYLPFAFVGRREREKKCLFLQKKLGKSRSQGMHQHRVTRLGDFTPFWATLKSRLGKSGKLIEALPIYLWLKLGDFVNLL